MYKNIINRDWLMICQDDTSLSKIRLSWFEDKHFQQEYRINLLESSEYDNKMINFDTYCLGRGEYCTFYCDYRNEWLIVDVWFEQKNDCGKNEFANYTRIYNLKELYNKGAY